MKKVKNNKQNNANLSYMHYINTRVIKYSNFSAATFLFNISLHYEQSNELCFYIPVLNLLFLFSIRILDYVKPSTRSLSTMNCRIHGGSRQGYSKNSKNVLTYATTYWRTPERVSPRLRQYAKRLGSGLTRS